MRSPTESGLFSVEQRLTGDQHGLAARLIFALSGLSQAARLYDVSNDVVQKVLGEMREIVGAFGRGQQAVTLTMAGHSFFINRRLIRMDFGTYRKAQNLRRSWDAVGLGELQLPASVPLADLQGFAAALLACVKTPERADELLFANAWPGGLVARRARGDDAPGQRIRPDLLVTRLYAGLLVLTERTVERFVAGQRPPSLRLKRALQLVIEQLETHEGALVALATRSQQRDRLATHLVNTAVLSLVVGRHAGLERRELVTLGLAALFHDVAKAGLNDRTLDGMEQPSRIAEGDRVRVGQHWLQTVKRLVEVSGFADDTVTRVVVLYESQLEFSGSDLYGEERALERLSLLSRIVRMADALDTAGWRRAGKPFIAADQIIAALVAHGAQGGDVALARLFLHALGLYPAGSVVQLSSGELAVVTSQGLHGDVRRPIVRLCVATSGERIDGPDIDLAVESTRSVVGVVDPQKIGVNVVAPHVGDIDPALAQLY